VLQWPVEWYHTDILKDITFLEMIPIVLSVFLWDRVFKRKKIAFHVSSSEFISLSPNSPSFFFLC
jgi:uncharacterized membrane protein